MRSANTVAIEPVWAWVSTSASPSGTRLLSASERDDGRRRTMMSWGPAPLSHGALELDHLTSARAQ
ncbi:MAG: hypothetical protein ABI665_08920 [Vicinamibacterales bacterium]